MTCRPLLSIPIEVRFADLDAYGHVNNATYFTYLEIARTRLHRERFRVAGRQGLLFMVVRAECEYRQPIEFGDRVVIDMGVERVGHSSFDLAYTLHDAAGRTFATAKTVMVCFDPELGKTTAIPAGFLDPAEPGE